MMQKLLFWFLVTACLTPWITPPIALLSGIALAQIFGNPFPEKTHTVSKKLLQISVIGLGFGMNFFSAMEASSEGFFLILGSILFTLLIGIVLGKIFKVDAITTLLISVGTAICGGSAIAAVSPIVRAKASQMTIALGTVFLLNAVALLIFPSIGHLLEMDQHTFGVWAAIAIHDTSSVVGAAEVYGDVALQTAVTLKLTRALWIIPVALGVMFFRKKKETQKLKFPWFIIGFVVAMMINTFVPVLSEVNSFVVIVAKQALVLTLFLVGMGFDRHSIFGVGIGALVLGVLLWLVVAVGSLLLLLLP